MLINILLVCNFLYIFIIGQILLPEFLGRDLVKSGESEYDMKIDLPRWSALEKRVCYMNGLATTAIMGAFVFYAGPPSGELLIGGLRTFGAIAGVFAVITTVLLLRRIFWGYPEKRSNA